MSSSGSLRVMWPRQHSRCTPAPVAVTDVVAQRQRIDAPQIIRQRRMPLPHRQELHRLAELAAADATFPGVADALRERLRHGLVQANSAYIARSSVWARSSPTVPSPIRFMT